MYEHNLHGMSRQSYDAFRIGEQQLRSTFRVPKFADWTNRRFQLFSVPLGGSGQGFASMKKVHTNLKEAGRMPSGTGFVVSRVSWEVYGGSARDQQVFWSNAYWQWEFAQVVVDGTPLQTFGSRQILQPKTDDNCGGCGAPLSDSRRCGYCDHLSGEVQGVTLMNTLEYEKYPIHIPSGSVFGITVEVDHDYTPSNSLFVRFTLGGQYKHVIEIG